MSPMQGKQGLTEAGKWEGDNANKRLAASEATPHAPVFRVQPFALARAAFTIYLCSAFKHRWHLSVYWRGFKIFYDTEE